MTGKIEFPDTGEFSEFVVPPEFYGKTGTLVGHYLPPLVTEVTAVLLSWKRPYHIPRLVEHLRTFQQIQQVIVMCNEFPPTQEIKALYDPSETKTADVIWSKINLCTLGRFYAASHATYDNVFVCDDDLLVLNIPQLLAEYDGTKIIANLADDAKNGTGSSHWQFWQRDPKPYVELGFGSIFPREWARQFLEMKWTDDLELSRRKADKAFTCLFPWKAVRAGPEDLTRLTWNGSESGRDTNALYRREDHRRLTDAAVAAALRFKLSHAVADRGDGARDCDANHG